jgi:hypothetical protein
LVHLQDVLTDGLCELRRPTHTHAQHHPCSRSTSAEDGSRNAPAAVRCSASRCLSARPGPPFLAAR